ncbi:MAG: hypothetical protein ACRDZX_13910 [Acidimicrobiales bacterium]
MSSTIEYHDGGGVTGLGQAASSRFTKSSAEGYVEEPTYPAGKLGPRVSPYADGAGSLGLGPYAVEEPGFQSIGRSALRHPVVVAVCALLGLVIGAVIAYAQPVTYTAQAKLMVGRTAGLAEDMVPGLAAAVDGLASDYARLATTSRVKALVKADLGTSLPGKFSASPVPNSSVIDVDGSASNKADALVLANAAADALRSVVVKATNDTHAQLKPVISAYSKADTLYETATARASVYQNQLNSLMGKVATQPGITPVQQATEAALEREIATAQTEADVAKMQANAYMNTYNSDLPPLQADEEMIQRVGTAVPTGSNRAPYMEVGVLGGVVGGLVFGLAAVSWADSRRGRRRLDAYPD